MLWTAILTIFGAGSVSGIGKRSVEDWDAPSYVDEKAKYEEDLEKWEADMRKWELEERQRKDEVVNNWFSNLFSSLTSSNNIDSNVQARLGVSFTDASFLAVLDDTFTFASTTKQFVLNGMGSVGELEETLKRLQNHKGVTGVIVIDGKGAVTKSSLDNTTTSKMAGLVKGITNQARSVVRDLDPVNELAFLRLRSTKTEFLIAPDKDYVLVVLQTPPSE